MAFFPDLANAFKIAPAGVITQIIGAGNSLDKPLGIAVDAASNGYVAADFSTNAFKIAAGNVPTVSEWGLVAMSLLLLTAGTLVCARRRVPSA